LTFIRKSIKFALRPFLPKLRRTAATWDVVQTSAAPEYWGNFQIVRSQTQKRITGDAKLSWFSMQVRKRQTPFGRVLAFGDGKGMAVEAAMERRDTSEIVYFNISEEECRRFRELASANRITCQARCIIGDANTFNFASLGSFDTIISVGAFHHLRKFDQIFSQLNRILAPDGLVYVDEFVGPRKWRYGRRVRSRINELLRTLPDSLVLSRKTLMPWDFYILWHRANEPSEAVRSDRLTSAIERNFTVREADGFGGSLLFPFFQTSYMRPCRLNIPNWHHTLEGSSELRRMVSLENQLIERGTLPKDYLYYVLQKKTADR
jgi:SAM-dependent methyltransferase